MAQRSCDRNMDGYDHTDKKQITFTSLQLLGFESHVMAKQHRIPFNKNMFDLPNKNAFEIVFYFLFKRLNAAMCYDQFTGSWPIRDKKSEQLFRKTCYNWLLTIAKEVPELCFPRITPTLFMAPGGEKFQQLLFAFTNYVLLQVTQSVNGVKSVDIIKCPQLTSQNGSLTPGMLNVVKVGGIIKRRDFFTHARQTVEVQRLWKEYALELVKEDRRLTKDLKDIEHNIRKEGQHAAVLSEKYQCIKTSRKSLYDLDTLAIKRAQCVSEVRELWKKLLSLFTSSGANRAMVLDVLNKHIDRPCIDAADIRVQVPDVLLRECEHVIRKRNIENTYEGGKLNLLSLVQLWNLSLYMYRDKLAKVGLGDVGPIIPHMSTQLHTHSAYLNNAKSLSKALAEKIIPDLKLSIANMRASLNRVPLPSPKTPIQKGHKFSLMAASPMLSFSPNPNIDDHHVTLLPTPDIETTPQAITKLIESVKAKTMRHAPSDDRHDLSLTPTHRPTSDPAIAKSKQNKVLTPQYSYSKKAISQAYDIRSLPGSSPVMAPTHPSNYTPKVTKATTLDSLDTITSDITTPLKLPLTPANTHTPNAHYILADKIVDAMMDDDGDINGLDVNLANPIAALDDSVFISKDKIMRTPDKNVENHPNFSQKSSPFSIHELQNSSHDVDNQIFNSFTKLANQNMNSNHIGQSDAESENVNAHADESLSLKDECDKSLNENKNADTTFDLDTRDVEFNYLKYKTDNLSRNNSAIITNEKFDRHSFGAINTSSLLHSSDEIDLLKGFGSRTSCDINDHILNNFPSNSFNQSSRKSPFEIVEKVAQTFVSESRNQHSRYGNDYFTDNRSRVDVVENDSEKENIQPLLVDSVQTPRLVDNAASQRTDSFHTSPVGREFTPLTSPKLSPQTVKEFAKLQHEMSHLISDNETSLLHLENMFKSFSVNASLNTSKSVNEICVNSDRGQKENSIIDQNVDDNFLITSQENSSILAENFFTSRENSGIFKQNDKPNNSYLELLSSDDDGLETLDDLRMPDTNFNDNFLVDLSPRYVKSRLSDVRRSASIRKIAHNTSKLLHESELSPSIPPMSGNRQLFNDSTFDKTPPRYHLNETFTNVAVDNLLGSPFINDSHFKRTRPDADVISDNNSRSSSVAGYNRANLSTNTSYVKNVISPHHSVDGQSDISDNNAESFSPATQGLTYTSEMPVKSIIPSTQTDDAKSNINAILSRYKKLRNATLMTTKTSESTEPENITFKLVNNRSTSPVITKEFLSRRPQKDFSLCKSPVESPQPQRTYAMSPLVSPSSVRDSSLMRHMSPSSVRYSLGLNSLHDDEGSFLVPSSP